MGDILVLLYVDGSVQNMRYRMCDIVGATHSNAIRVQAKESSAYYAATG